MKLVGNIAKNNIQITNKKLANVEHKIHLARLLTTKWYAIKGGTNSGYHSEIFMTISCRTNKTNITFFEGCSRINRNWAEVTRNVSEIKNKIKCRKLLEHVLLLHL